MAHLLTTSVYRAVGVIIPGCIRTKSILPRGTGMSGGTSKSLTGVLARRTILFDEHHGGLLPARKAAAADPLQALREQG
jgi:hypothetical protein